MADPDLPDAWRHVDRAACTLTLETPVSDLDDVHTLRLGDVRLDPDTYDDYSL